METPFYDKSARVRRQAVEGLSAVLADGAGIDAKVIVPALRDPESEVRSAAAEALARSGRQAIAPMIELPGEDGRRIEGSGAGAGARARRLGRRRTGSRS